MGCQENAENIVMAARAEGQTRMPSIRTKHSQRDVQTKGKERRRKGWRRREQQLWPAVKISYHNVHDTGIPTQVLISSLGHTSRRGSYFRQRAGSTVHTGRVVFPVIAPSHFDD